MNHIWRWANLLFTLALRFKVVVYYTFILDTRIPVFMCVHICTELWLWICHTFDALVSDCIHTYINCKLQYIRLIFVYIMTYQTMVEGYLIIRRSTINSCVMWLLKICHVKVFDVLWRWEAGRNACVLAVLLFVTARLSIRPSSRNISSKYGRILLKLVYFSEIYREEPISIKIWK